MFKERLTALYLLYNAHLHGKSSSTNDSQSDLSDNPFLPLLADLVVSKHSSISVMEHAFLVDLFLSPKTFSSQTVNAIVSSLPSKGEKAVSSDLSNRISQLITSYKGKEEGFEMLSSPWKRNALNRAVYDSTDTTAEDREILSSDAVEGIEVGGGKESTKIVHTKFLSSMGGFEPRWIR